MVRTPKSGLDRLLGPVPFSLGAGLQFFVVIVALALTNQLVVEYLLPVWYKRGLASTTEMWSMMLATHEMLLASWQASLRHLLVGVLGAFPGFLIGTWLSTYRRFEPATLFLVGMAICYPKLAISVIFGFVVLGDELSIAMFGWWVSAVYSMAIGFFIGRHILSGQHQMLGQGALDLAVLHLNTRSRFYLFFLLPHSLREMPNALMLSSAAIVATFIFSESRVGGPGIGYEAYYVVTNSHNMPLFHVAALLIGLTNLFFWGVLNLLRQKYWSVIESLTARLMDWKLGR